MTQRTIRLYAYSIAAGRRLTRKEAKFEHAIGMVQSFNCDLAYYTAMTYAFAQWPVSQGWNKHAAQVQEIFVREIEGAVSC